MNNDLISREALRKLAIWTKVNNGAELIDIEVVPLDAIDNAPTVELVNDSQRLVKELVKGEWIEKVERRGCFAGDKTVYSYTCPFCKAKEFKKYPFCHCGADLRGVQNDKKENCC